MAILNTTFAKLAKTREDGGYVWGADGEIMTPDRYKWFVRRFGKSRYRYGNKWNGKFVADCSGLVVWLMRELTESHTWRDATANSIYHYRCKPIKKSELKIGSLCFRQNSKGRITHVAIYIGDNKVIHARSSYYGIRIDKLFSSFNRFGNLKDMEFKPVIEYDKPEYKRLLRKRYPYMKGLDVKQVQRELNKEGFDSGVVDGVYGRKTKRAVLQFQYANFRDKREHDGIVGRKTWSKLFDKQR